MAKKASDVIRLVDKKLDKAIKKATNTNNLNALGAEMVTTVQKRTRLGKGVKNGKLVKLAPLEASTKKTRLKYEKNLSPLTRPKKSNLTATGQMLDAMRFKLSGILTKRITIFFENKRSNELSGSQSKLTNSQVAIQVQENGRTFFILSNTEIKRFTRTLRKLITDSIRRAL